MKIEELIDRYFEGQTHVRKNANYAVSSRKKMYRNRYKYTVPCLSAWIRKQKHSGKKVLLLKSLPSAVALFTQREE